MTATGFGLILKAVSVGLSVAPRCIFDQRDACACVYDRATLFAVLCWKYAHYEAQYSIRWTQGVKVSVLFQVVSVLLHTGAKQLLPAVHRDIFSSQGRYSHMSALNRASLAVGKAVRQFHASPSSAGGDVCFRLLRRQTPASL